MPLYELADGELTPFARLNPGPELYEQELESLVWENLEAFLGEALFPIARQPQIAGGGRPDIVALDESGRVVVIEIKRDIDRSQLAQCLEYAGWARLTSLDEVATLYNGGPGHKGVESFFKDWQDFTESTTPATINPQPRLVLIARDFQGRTRSALDFLRENSLPVTVVPVTVYADEMGRKIVSIDADHEPSLGPHFGVSIPTGAMGATPARVTVLDLIEAGLVQADEPVQFIRPRLGQRFDARITSDGKFITADGTIHQSPSMAAMKAADLVSYDGWHAWRVTRLGGTKLDELRQQFLSALND